MAATPDNDLSFCRIDGHLIFLDIGNDRYFRLPDHLEVALISHLEGNDLTSQEADELSRRIDLKKLLGNVGNEADSALAPPSHSATEQRNGYRAFHIGVLLEVLATVASTQLQLKTRTLKQVIDSLTVRRGRSFLTAPLGPTEALTRRALEAAGTFTAARPYVPIETCCLLDSISLVRFLSRRGLAASVVFGVIRDPFSAHCWVQAGEWVLNDTLGNIAANTPIRTV